ncbi:archease [Natronolimnobius baerhuensis]|uniref:Protein archease n=1 Tax=Natronolimnobius baerhuensis TaxID=253108 RepID=A0A202E7A8_9EURY|nr:archease [Natronolimnobius baerhuensis]OVE84151.1 protein archease [Natronolimnobius baerhuensis]
MAYELRDHTADIAVAATGDTLEAVVSAVADGLAAASCDDVPADTGERFSLTVSAESREALLFDYLDELIYLRDVRVELPVDHCVESIQHASADDNATGADEWTLEASARGVPLSAIDAREIKAVTYSEMTLERIDDGDGWSAYVVFDV